MAIIGAVGLGIPEYEIPQNQVKTLAKDLFSYTDKQFARMLPVFDHAAIEARQFVVDASWFLQEHNFEERNNLYHQFAIKHSLKAMDDCLASANLSREIDYSNIDLISFVSSTGIATPSLDVFLMNERSFREDVERMPLWGLGCAGGAIGLSRVSDWLTANPEKIALLVNCELCSLTFQKSDQKKSNLVGTALFGDGISAVLLVGEKSPYRKSLSKPLPNITSASSYTKKFSTDIMGWKVTDSGFEVVFSKSIPALVKTTWKEHLEQFLHRNQLDLADIHSFIVHPGGKKVLSAMEESLTIPSSKLKYSYEVLKKHGNMSSATVQYVLRQWLEEGGRPGNKSVISALGPGFSSEILLVEWVIS
ncbi:type III polyketide synthase [Ornithinibacillus contaminans]|uniref:type III polyketide synthase n=1 Tax=Ornithinibacillus contaminans TaxID=694055 RepID=UPI00064D88AC|nr:3-oxoacyl-[acyl-carrier-protein] synthase III C-terminal domain-containing protein [Ornithinibacillus contaminans]